MIRQKIYIDRYDWIVHCFFAAKPTDATEILAKLVLLGINKEEFYRASEHLHSSDANGGMTYSSRIRRESVVVFGHASSSKEALNTFTHELRHLADDICSSSDIPCSGEPVAYLTGDISMQLAANLLHIVCECPLCKNGS